MIREQGNLSINSENIFPIIKKWLYSDHDIFYRELVSNSSDAITKLKKLALIGETELAEDNQFRIDVIVNSEEKTITFSDNGIGMTIDEVKTYINQIAFSGATDFINKYKDKTNEEQIIGHFGLGFYSAFMVADKVTIDTLSFKDDAVSVHWESVGGTEFTMEEGTKESRGTTITLYLNEDSFEFSNEYRAKEVLKKYCAFMPVEIFLTNANAVEEVEELEETEEVAEDIVDVTVDEDGTASEDKKDDKKEVPINKTTPLWMKHPNECTEEEYKEFYREVFNDFKEPLFWIHLNMDYPFNLKGILYFPKLNTEYDQLEGTIKLFNNQVFIADNIKEVIPEFLMLLKGAIDCPDLPLNVSRSALQNDGFVKKISDYISKKVADKLSGMYKVEKESYEKFWEDISPFIKFGCLKDDKFKEKMKDFIIFKNLDGKYLTLPEYVANVKADKDGSESVENNAENKTEEQVNVYYVSNEQQQSQYINMFREEKIDALLLTHNIDQPFISLLEQTAKDYKFLRIDSDITERFTEEVSEDTLKEFNEKLTELFRKVLNKEKLEVKVMKLKNDKVASMITLSEENRRMQDMMKMYNMGGMDPSMFGPSESLVLNANHPLVDYVFNKVDNENVSMICEQLYDLAILSHKPLDGVAMTKFIARSNEIMVLLTK